MLDIALTGGWLEAGLHCPHDVLPVLTRWFGHFGFCRVSAWPGALDLVIGLLFLKTHAAALQGARSVALVPTDLTLILARGGNFALSGG